MLTSLMLSLALAVPQVPAPLAAPRGSSEPPVRLSLNSDGRYRPGDRARVHVRTEEDGYLVVLRTEVDGRVRVLYPADPFDDDFVRGGREVEIRDRGNREAFAVSRYDGTGVVLAAFSTTPFDFQQFVRNDHWDYRVFDTLRSDTDPEAALLAITDGMAAGRSIEYDVMTYTVSDGRNDDRVYTSSYYPTSYYGDYSYPACWSCSRGYGWSLSFTFGSYRPWYRSAFYFDPFFYSCWGCYSPSYFGLRGGYYRPWGYSYAYGPFRPNSWGRGGFGSRFYGGRSVLASGFRTNAIDRGRAGSRFAVQRQPDQRSFGRASLVTARREATPSNVGQRRTLDDRTAVQRAARPSVARRETPPGNRAVRPSQGVAEPRRAVSREPARSGSGGRSPDSYSGGRASSGGSRGSARPSSGGSAGGRVSSGGGRVSSGSVSRGGGGQSPSSGGGSGGGGRRR